MLLTEVGEGGVSIRFISCRICKGGMLLRDGGDKGGIPGTSPELMVGKADNSVTEKVGGGSDVGGMASPLSVGFAGKGPVFGVVGKGGTLLMEASDNGEIESAVKTGSIGKGPIVGAVGKGGLIVGAVGKGRTLLIEGGCKVEMGSPVGVGSASIGLPVAGGFRRPSERRKQMRSLQPYGSLVAAVGAGESKRLSERMTQSRESHLRGSVVDEETGKTADVDSVVLITGVVRGFKSPEFPGPLGVGLKVQSGSQSGQRFGGGNQGGEANPGGGGFNGILGSSGGSGTEGFNGILG